MSQLAKAHAFPRGLAEVCGRAMLRTAATRVDVPSSDARQLPMNKRITGRITKHLTIVINTTPRICEAMAILAKGSLKSLMSFGDFLETQYYIRPD